MIERIPVSLTLDPAVSQKFTILNLLERGRSLALQWIDLGTRDGFWEGSMTYYARELDQKIRRVADRPETAETAIRDLLSSPQVRYTYSQLQCLNNPILTFEKSDYDAYVELLPTLQVLSGGTFAHLLNRPVIDLRQALILRYLKDIDRHLVDPPKDLIVAFQKENLVNPNIPLESIRLPQGFRLYRSIDKGWEAHLRDHIPVVILHQQREGLNCGVFLTTDVTATLLSKPGYVKHVLSLDTGDVLNLSTAKPTFDAAIYGRYALYRELKTQNVDLGVYKRQIRKLKKIALRRMSEYY